MEARVRGSHFEGSSPIEVGKVIYGRFWGIDQDLQDGSSDCQKTPILGESKACLPSIFEPL